MSFAGLVIVCSAAFAAPLLLGLVPRVRVPAVVLEILAGILIGPAGLGWVTVDEPIRVLSRVGLAFLLFLAGLELDVELLRGERLKLALAAFAVSCGIGLAVSYSLRMAGIVETAPLVAIVLLSTGLGIIAPVLKDAGEIGTAFGQLVIAAASIADFGTVLLLSFFFSRQASSPATKILLLGGFGVLTAAMIACFAAAERWDGLSRTMVRLQDSTAQIRIRGAFLLLVAFAALAERQGLEVILGAFVAGGLLAVVDRNYQKTHPKFHEKLGAIGFGVFIPVFFVTTGLQFDLRALFADAATLARIPVFLLALVAVRGVPALLYRRLFGAPRALVAGLLQATTLPFIVATTKIGVELGNLSPTNAAALIAAGLLSVIIFPTTAMALLARAPDSPSQQAALS